MPTVPKRAIAKHQFLRIADHGPNSGLLEQALEQDEFRVQILRLRRFVDDGDTHQLRGTARAFCHRAPLGAKHLEKQVLRRIAGEITGHFYATAPNAVSVLRAFVFGRIAGAEAATDLAVR